MMNENTNLVFKLKITQAEIEQFILRALELDNQIGSKEEMFFTQMTKVGKSFYMEFVVPAPKKSDE